MADKIKGLTVTLDDVNEIVAGDIIKAIKYIRGVVSVEKHVADVGHYMAVSKAKNELQHKIIRFNTDLLYGKDD